MQADGAEMLRLATWRLCEAGIVPIMLIHDGILFEETSREKIEHAMEIMRAAAATPAMVWRSASTSTKCCERRPLS